MVPTCFKSAFANPLKLVIFFDDSISTRLKQLISNGDSIPIRLISVRVEPNLTHDPSQAQPYTVHPSCTQDTHAKETNMPNPDNLWEQMTQNALCDRPTHFVSHTLARVPLRRPPMMRCTRITYKGRFLLHSPARLSPLRGRRRNDGCRYTRRYIASPLLRISWCRYRVGSSP